MVLAQDVEIMQATHGGIEIHAKIDQVGNLVDTCLLQNDSFAGQGLPSSFLNSTGLGAVSGASRSNAATAHNASQGSTRFFFPLARPCK